MDPQGTQDQMENRVPGARKETKGRQVVLESQAQMVTSEIEESEDLMVTQAKVETLGCKVTVVSLATLGTPAVMAGKERGVTQESVPQDRERKEIQALVPLAHLESVVIRDPLVLRVYLAEQDRKEIAVPRDRKETLARWVSLVTLAPMASLGVLVPED